MTTENRRPWKESQHRPEGMKARDLAFYNTLRIDLSKERDKEQINPYGDADLLLVVEQTGSADIRLNKKNAPALPLSKIPKIKTLFNDVYLSNDPQPGEYIEIVIGGDLEGFSALDADTLHSLGIDQIQVTDTVGLKADQLSFDENGKLEVVTDATISLIEEGVVL